jgi:hypothetical protein
MVARLNLPDGFITILDARTRCGRALYGKRWPEIEKASNDQLASGGMMAFAARKGADGETIQSLGERVKEAARQSWKYRTPAVTVLRDWLLLGTLKGYLFRPGQIPELQPNDLWKGTEFMHGLLAGYIYEGTPNQQRKAYIIVQEGELAEALKTYPPSALTKKVEPPDKPARVALPKQKKRGGGPKHGRYYGPLKRHLKWRKYAKDDLDTALLKDLREDARNHLIANKVKDIPKSRSAFNAAILDILRTLGANR